MGRIVIVAFRPKPGQESALLEEVPNHVPTLRREGLATDRPTAAMRAGDGTMVEVFEWTSARVVEDVHKHPALLTMW